MASPPEHRGNRPKSAFRVTRLPYADLSGEGARRVGGRWNSAGRAALYLALMLRVASILVLRASNFILNPAHPLAAHIRIESLEPFAFDRRLLERK